MSDLEHLAMKAREAARGGINAMSTGEALAAALILNRVDWLNAMNYTIAEALDRVDRGWLLLIPRVAKMIAEADGVIADARAAAQDEAALSSIASSEDTTDVTAKLVSYGHAPGYRDTSFTFDLQRPGAPTKHRVCIQIGHDDGESVVAHILRTQRSAWERGRPIDAKPSEQRPRWIDNP